MPNSVPGVAPPKIAAGSGGADSRDEGATGVLVGPLPAQADSTSAATPTAAWKCNVRIRFTVKKTCATLAASP
jgi:hypothetical protein